MTEAVLNLITRDAVELHFEGATYGPVSHTEPLAVLLLLLSPSKVRCIANGPKFEQAMQRLLASAQQVKALLEQAHEGEDGDERGAWPTASAIDCWFAAALEAVPAGRVAHVRELRAARMESTAPGATVH
jgi:hypothetical protein